MKIFKEKNRLLYLFIGLAIALIVIGVFDRGLAVGFSFLVFLTVATVALAHKAGIRDRQLYIVFFAALAVHLGAVLFIYYAHFNPFGGGADYDGYNQTAIQLSQRFWQGNFSLKGFYTEHFFPILITVIYMITVPTMIVGQLFTVWLAGVSVFLIYLMVLAVGGSKKSAVLASGLAILYPSYIFFGSLLLKDTVVIPLVFIGLLLILKMAKHFSWVKFLLFFAILTALINLRFYVGYALMISMVVCWPLLSPLTIKKKMTYWLAMIFLLGFSPYLLGNGYYGFNSFSKFLNPKEITYFREVVYAPKPPAVAPVSSPTPAPVTPGSVTPGSPPPAPSNPSQPSPAKPEVKDNGSTFVIETGFSGGPLKFLTNSALSFTYSLLGPFPWQFTQKRQLAGLVETIPWYLLIGAFIYASARFIKRKGVREYLVSHRLSLPLLVFGVLALGALSLYINNYGIIARIRIPMFICFVAVMCVSFSDVNYNEKILNYWRSWFYRLPFIKSTFGSGQ